ncbi:hypothetical protein V1519DRAFT_450524 [Lipomyces tetrasporus]
MRKWKCELEKGLLSLWMIECSICVQSQGIDSVTAYQDGPEPDSHQRLSRRHPLGPHLHLCHRHYSSCPKSCPEGHGCLSSARTNCCCPRCSYQSHCCPVRAHH